MKTTISVIFTGGTIGSMVKGDYISPDEEQTYELVWDFCRKHDKEAENIDFRITEPYTILSENMSMREYPSLTEAILSAVQTDRPKAVIVTHGSDTLAYTGAMLSLALRELSVPVFLVASNYILDDPRANGPVNFACAVKASLAGQKAGVYVPYANPGEEVRIYRGDLLLPHEIYSDRVKALEPEKDYPSADILLKETGLSWELPAGDAESHVLWIRPAPGMRYPLESLQTGKYRAVLQDTYHSGTISTVASGLREFMQYAHGHSVPVYYVGTTPSKDYETCKIYEELGMKPLPPISPIMAYALLSGAK